MSISDTELLARALEKKQKFAKHVSREFLIEKACNGVGIFNKNDVQKRIQRIIPRWDDLPHFADPSYVRYGMTKDEIQQEFADRRELV